MAEEEEMEEGDRYGETAKGATVEAICVGGDLTPLEENVDLLDFTPDCAHLLFQGVNGYFPHHNDGSHLDGEGCGRCFMAASLAPASCATG